MLYRQLSDPLQFQYKTELIHFILVTTMVIVVRTLTGGMNELRRSLLRQKTELAAAVARLHEVATRGELTGLPNRRHKISMLESQVCHRSACQALIDIERVKLVNDTYGHAASLALAALTEERSCPALLPNAQDP